MKRLVGIQALSLVSIALAAADPAGELSLASTHAEAEVLLTSDVGIVSLDWTTDWTLADNWTGSVRLNGSHHAVDYLPQSRTDPLGRPSDRSEWHAGAAISASKSAGRNEWAATVSAYSGFRSLADIWLDEYYRQQYAGGGIPGAVYSAPDPQGWGATAQLRHEWIPGASFLTVSLAYLRDHVAPGYEIEDTGTSFALVRGIDTLETIALSASWEGVVNRAIRLRQSFGISRTSERDPRLSATFEANISLGLHWISRSVISGTIEEPEFQSFSIAQSFEWEAFREHFVYIALRAYRDTGQIESANLISSAAPGLDTLLAQLGWRWQTSATASFLAATGPYWTRYDATGIGTERFAGLYRDRDWWWSRVAVEVTF